MRRVTEADRRVADLEDALNVIGRIVLTEGVTPKRRLERIAGVLERYDAMPRMADIKEPVTDGHQ